MLHGITMEVKIIFFVHAALGSVSFEPVLTL